MRSHESDARNDLPDVGKITTNIIGGDTDSASLVTLERSLLSSNKTTNAEKKLMQRIESGEIADQPCWSFIKELNSVSEERLDNVALIDGYRQYSYRQMFRAWERYAEAFSGLGLTGENKSRVGIVSVTLSETIFAMYGLNMTGASISMIYHLDLYDEKQIYSMIEREKITDLIISELFAFPNLMKRLLNDRERLGIKNIVVLPSPMGGDYAIPALDVARKLNKELCREIPELVMMEDILEKYEAHPIAYAKKPGQFILHTTGTVSGMHKPVPLSNKNINTFVVNFIKAKDTLEDFKRDFPEHPVTCVPFYLSWAYFMVNSMHTSLCMGAEVICLPMASMNPRYSQAIVDHKVNVIFTGMVFDTWNKTRPQIDLSELKFVIMGGTYISPEYKKEFNKYLKSCGSSANFVNGYGLSELCGAIAICPSSREDDAIGYLLPGIKSKIFVEDEGRYYDIADGPRTGILLVSSDAMSSGELDGTRFFDLEEVDGEKYFNTHDLMRVEEDGCLICIGRSNNYFVNNAGVRFNAGLVERAVSSQEGIRFCGLAPEFHKVLHDNVPILYVEMKEPGDDETDVLRKALIKVFIENDVIADSNLPSQVVVVEHMPLNSNGKVDGKLLKAGKVQGVRYSIKPVLLEEKLVDIVLVLAPEGDVAAMDSGVPQELEDDPYNLLSAAFAAIPDVKENGISAVLKIPGLRELILKLTDFDIDNIPQSMWYLAPKLLSMLYKDYLMPMVKDLSQLDNLIPSTDGEAPSKPFMQLPGFDEFNTGLTTLVNQFIDAQKSSIGSNREQWDQISYQITKMEDTIVDSLPEQLPALPGFAPLPFSPKEMMRQWQKFGEMSRKNFLDQADYIANFSIMSQEQMRDKASDAAKKPAKKKDAEPKAKAAPAKKKSSKPKAKPAKKKDSESES
jgi:acyl-coenzyme A synthetase/AMP-(fatty) acid ligase